MASTCKYGEASVPSRTNTPEYDAGYEAAFGPDRNEIRVPKRTRYVYRGGKLVEQFGPEDVGGPEAGGDDARLRVVSDLYMDGIRSSDGVDIGSHAKRWRYMNDREDGRVLADMDDFKGEWAKAEKRREAIRRGEDPTGQRRQMIGKALYEASKKR